MKSARMLPKTSSGSQRPVRSNRPAMRKASWETWCEYAGWDEMWMMWISSPFLRGLEVDEVQIGLEKIWKR